MKNPMEILTEMEAEGCSKFLIFGIKVNGKEPILNFDNNLEEGDGPLAIAVYESWGKRIKQARARKKP